MPVACWSQTLVCSIAFFNSCLVGYLLFRHLKKNSTNKILKTITIVLVLLLQIVLFVHYFFVFRGDGLEVIFLIQELLTNLCFNAVCFMSARQCSRFLGNAKIWTTILRVMLVVNIVIVVLLSVLKFTFQAIDHITD